MKSGYLKQCGLLGIIFSYLKHIIVLQTND